MATECKTICAVFSTRDGLRSVVPNFGLFANGVPVERVVFPLVVKDPYALAATVRDGKQIQERAYKLEVIHGDVAYYHEQD
jgi:hypothetical protein